MTSTFKSRNCAPKDTISTVEKISQRLEEQIFIFLEEQIFLNFGI